MDKPRDQHTIPDSFGTNMLLLMNENYSNVITFVIKLNCIFPSFVFISKFKYI